MTEVITGLLKLTFGLVSKKLRTYGAEKLQDGGLTDQKFRSFIVRELDDIKSKLDAISRKDLCAGISFLQQGIQRLNMSIGESSESDNSSKLPGKQSKATTTASAGACLTNKKPPHQTVAVEDAVALANAIGKLKVESNERFELAKKSFEETAKRATQAFHNAALSTDERTLASKIRIASGILQHLEDPEFAATDCLQYLRELHDMSAIKEIFSVHLGKGIKSWFKSGFNKNSRAEIVESVMMMNWILADFITKFTKQRMAVFDWPMIECDKRIVHPIHYDKKSLPNMKEITPPWDIVETQEELKWRQVSRVVQATTEFVRELPPYALTTKGDFIYLTKNERGLQKLNKAKGKMQPYCSLPSYEIIGIAIDKDDAVYVLSRDKKYTLSIYSRDGRNTHHCSLEFLQGMSGFKYITVSNNKNIVICFRHAAKIMVYLCNCTGSLINSFELPLPNRPAYLQVKSVSFSCDNEIILTILNKLGDGDWSNVLYIYSTDGQLKTTVKFHPSECKDTYYSLCYNHDTKTIIGHLGDDEADKILIEYLSGQTAKLQLSYVLYNTNFPKIILYSDLLHHANTGTLALVTKNHVLLLQKPSP